MTYSRIMEVTVNRTTHVNTKIQMKQLNKCSCRAFENEIIVLVTYILVPPPPPRLKKVLTVVNISIK